MWTSIHHTWMDRYVYCMANTTLTAAHVKSAVQSQVLCADCSYSQHVLQFHGGGAVSGFTHCIFFKMRLFGEWKALCKGCSWIWQPYILCKVRHSFIHPQTQAHNWTCAPCTPKHLFPHCYTTQIHRRYTNTGLHTKVKILHEVDCSALRTWWWRWCRWWRWWWGPGSGLCTVCGSSSALGHSWNSRAAFGLLLIENICKYIYIYISLKYIFKNGWRACPGQSRTIYVREKNITEAEMHILSWSNHCCWRVLCFYQSTRCKLHPSTVQHPTLFLARKNSQCFHWYHYIQWSFKLSGYYEKNVY